MHIRHRRQRTVHGGLQFASVRLDEERTRCQPCHQRRAAHIQHKQALRQGEHQVAVILRRTFRRQQPRQDDILPRSCLFRQQVRKRPLIRRVDRRAGFVQLRHARAVLRDNLHIRAHVAVHGQENMRHLLAVQLAANRVNAVLARTAEDAGRNAQPTRSNSDIDALAAHILPRGQDTVHIARREGTERHRAVKRRIQAHTSQHGQTSPSSAVHPIIS